MVRVPPWVLRRVGVSGGEGRSVVVSIQPAGSGVVAGQALAVRVVPTTRKWMG